MIVHMLNIHFEYFCTTFEKTVQCHEYSEYVQVINKDIMLHVNIIFITIYLYIFHLTPKSENCAYPRMVCLGKNYSWSMSFGHASPT